ADLVLPILADLRKVIGPNVCGTTALGTMQYDNRRRRKSYFRIGFAQERIIPLSNSSEIDTRENLGCEIEFRASGKIVCWNSRAQNCRQVEDTEPVRILKSLQLLVAHRAVGPTKIRPPLQDLAYSSTRPDSLVGDLRIGMTLLV